MDTSTPVAGDGITAEQAGQRLVERRAERSAALQKESPSDITADVPATAEDLANELAPPLQVRKRENTESDDDYEPQANAQQEDDGEIEYEEDPPEDDAAEEVAAEAQEEPDAQEDAHEAADSVRFESVEELAGALEMQVDDLLDSLQITTKIDGKTETVPLSQLRKGYQLEQTANRRLQQVAEKQNQLMQQEEQARTRIGQQFQQAGLVFKMASDALMSDFQGVDWTSLERDEPERYTVLRQKFGERKAQLDNMIATATRQAETYMQEANAKREQEKQQRFADEAAKVQEKIPDFGKNQEHVKAVAAVLDEVGYNHDELNSIEDHRLILLANMAVKGQETTSRQDLLKKKLQKLPPVAKPGNQNKRPMSASKKAELSARKKLKSTGSADDAARLLLARRGIVR